MVCHADEVAEAVAFEGKFECQLVADDILNGVDDVVLRCCAYIDAFNEKTWCEVEDGGVVVASDIGDW